VPPAGSDIKLWENVTKIECLQDEGVLEGKGCDHGTDVYLMSMLLFFGAFAISITLKQFKTTGYFPLWVRSFLSDFAVIIGILSMTCLDYFSGIPTAKLNVPSEFRPTSDTRQSWLVAHALIFPDHVLSNPWWVDVFLAPVFALLATILIFMDQQITAVIVNRKDYKLVKGCGYHLDLLVLALIVVISSVFGLPWFIANTIPSINHMQSLTKESTTTIPGEKSKFLGIREQRVTSLLIAILTGLSVLMTPILAILPMPVLYGVFLFMGVSSLRGLQFFDRLLLLFMPNKYQPNYVYLKYVPLTKVHLFTLIQLGSLVVLWLIKSFPATSIAFPIMLVVICFIRKIVECVFTTQELRALDDLLPESGKQNKRKLGIKNDQEFNESDEDDIDGPGMNRLTNLSRDSGLKRRQKNVERSAMIEEQLEELIKNNGTRKPRVGYAAGHKVLSPQRTPAIPLISLTQPDKRVTMYLKLEDDEIFTPVHLSPVRLNQLIRTLKDKFAVFKESQKIRVLQKNMKGITFPLDDLLMNYLQDHQIFVLSISGDNDEQLTVTMVEQKLD